MPQISIVTGVSAGGGAYSPALTDFVVMTESARMFLTGPKIVREALGEEVSMEDLGGPGVHGANGVCQLVAPTTADAAASAASCSPTCRARIGEAPAPLAPGPAPDGDPGGVGPGRGRGGSTTCAT